jgi:hypothetical protein
MRRTRGAKLPSSAYRIPHHAVQQSQRDANNEGAMLDLIHIRDILELGLAEDKNFDGTISPEAKESCRLMIEVIDEGRVTIAAKAR